MTFLLDGELFTITGFSTSVWAFHDGWNLQLDLFLSRLWILLNLILWRCWWKCIEWRNLSLRVMLLRHFPLTFVSSALLILLVEIFSSNYKVCNFHRLSLLWLSFIIWVSVLIFIRLLVALYRYSVLDVEWGSWINVIVYTRLDGQKLVWGWSLSGNSQLLLLVFKVLAAKFWVPIR